MVRSRGASSLPLVYGTLVVIENKCKEMLEYNCWRELRNWSYTLIIQYIGFCLWIVGLTVYIFRFSVVHGVVHSDGRVTFSSSPSANRWLEVCTDLVHSRVDQFTGFVNFPRPIFFPTTYYPRCQQKRCIQLSVTATLTGFGFLHLCVPSLLLLPKLP